MKRKIERNQFPTAMRDVVNYTSKSINSQQLIPQAPRVAALPVFGSAVMNSGSANPGFMIP